ncbi:hypothetical protein [Kineococcus radiotolerans]|uniref:Uncharacterized protein n=1 Tax=Kineococcus radiotolerans (strain ATCC BAA-149 / DSM 14245 / SRS30216) TaxID=266940 RepID=A6WA80_KINRD|nr:hypothetical protein [Kineococcus radiotolerans]ABS03719.1 hypothetical protein Krad_2238 [Kineococcus radiotolerans SRS30216 = ATCC BAA-149]
MPRITMHINTRRATTVGLTSFATLTLIPLLAPAKASERALLLLAAVPAAALFGYLAGYATSSATGSATHLDAAQQDIQLRAAHLQAAHRSASTTAQPSAPVIRLISEPLPPSGTGSPAGSGHLAGLARPPAQQHQHQHQEPQSKPQQGLHLVPAPIREATATADAAVQGPRSSDPHLTLIVTHPTQHPAS